METKTKMTIIDIRLFLKGSLDNDQHLTENTVYSFDFPSFGNHNFECKSDINIHVIGFSSNWKKNLLWVSTMLLTYGMNNVSQISSMLYYKASL